MFPNQPKLVALRCRFCGGSRDALPSRDDPLGLSYILTRCNPCYNAGHTDPVILEYYDDKDKRLPAPPEARN